MKLHIHRIALLASGLLFAALTSACATPDDSLSTAEATAAEQARLAPADGPDQKAAPSADPTAVPCGCKSGGECSCGGECKCAGEKGGCGCKGGAMAGEGHGGCGCKQGGDGQGCGCMQGGDGQGCGCSQGEACSCGCGKHE